MEVCIGGVVLVAIIIIVISLIRKSADKAKEATEDDAAGQSPQRTEDTDLH